jgi:hypothetical protein
MSDAEKPAVVPVQPAKFPEGYNFPEELLSEWVNIPTDEPLLIGPLTRADLDQLLFSTGDIVRGVALLRSALIQFSTGNIEGSTNALESASNALTDGEPS